MSATPNPMRGEGASQPAGPSPRPATERRDPLQLRDRRQGERRDESLAVHLTEQVVVLAAEQWANAQEALEEGRLPVDHHAGGALRHAVDAYKAARAVAMAASLGDDGSATLGLLCWLGALAAGLAMTQLGVATWPRFAAGMAACVLLVAGAYLRRVAREG